MTQYLQRLCCSTIVLYIYLHANPSLAAPDWCDFLARNLKPTNQSINQSINHNGLITTKSELSLEDIRQVFAADIPPAAEKYGDHSILEKVAEIWDKIPTRSAASDRMAAQLVQERLAEYRSLGGLVVVESGGAHSIAICSELAEAGYRPILKIGLHLRENVPESFTQTAAAMKHYAERMMKARASLPPDAPIALIMDTHRDGIGIDPQIRDDYGVSDFPSADEIKAQFNGKIIWITEGKERTGPLKPITDYVAPHFRHLAEDGVEIYQHFADPYHNGTPGEYVKID